MKKILDGIWEIPWSISVDIRWIRDVMKDKEVEIKHIYREGNTLADFLTNHIFSFAGTKLIHFNSTQELPSQEIIILQLDKQNLLQLRVRKCQNVRFNIPITN